MSLLDKASLIITPNAEKVGKLYSVIPSDGNADLTVVRGTTATRLNSLGVIENVAINEPRLNYDTVGGCPAILIEPQRMNRLLNSETVVTQTISTTGVACTVSFYGTGTITFSGTFTGSLVGTGANNRVSLTFTPTTGSLLLTVTGSVTKGQLETGSYATSYIPTLGSAQTRNADVITRNNIYTNGLITSLGGTWFIELNNNIPYIRDNASATSIQTSNVSSLNGFVIKTSAGGLNRCFIGKRVSNVESVLYATLTNTVKIAIDWNGTTADVFVNGVKVVTATSFPATIMEFFTSDAIDVPKHIKSMMLFPRPLTDTECINLTTL
jgi:hypothetical protein